MDLSPHAARALQQVEMGLLMLYGASYFSEDEWYKIDNLLHKGEYTFTTGPPQQNPLEDELMTFDDVKLKDDTYGDASMSISKENAEQQTVPAPSNGIVASVESLNETSAEISSEDESGRKYELFDFSENTAPSSAGASTDGITQKLPDDFFKFAQADTTSSAASRATAIGQLQMVPFDLSSNNPSPHTPPPMSIINETTQDVEEIIVNPLSPSVEPLVTTRFNPTTAPFEPKSEEIIDSASVSFGPSPVSALDLEITTPESSNTGVADTATDAFEIPKREIKPIPKEGGLAYYTQQQVDELKEFNATLTKAGEKSRGRSQREEPKHNEAYSGHHEAPARKSSYMEDWPMTGSTSAAEHGERIQTWASGVDSAEPPSYVPTSVPEENSPEENSPEENSPSVPSAILIRKFVETHGRNPKSSNDIVQPNNPDFRRSISRASNERSVKSNTKSSLTPKQSGPGPELRVKSGTILIAQSNFTAKSGIQIDVRAGDKVQIIKHVSGTLHYAQTLHNRARGQIPESVFKRAPTQHADTVSLQGPRSFRCGNRAPSIVSNALDRVEHANAANWEEESVVSKTRAPAAKSTNGLSQSRYAVRDDYESEQQKQIEDLARAKADEIKKLVNERAAQMVAAENSASENHASSNRATPKLQFKALTKEPPPRTVTCWHWKTGKGCRYTASECRHLHHDVPGNPDAIAVVNGKPTWGSIHDGPLAQPAPLENYGNKRSCWYWANDKCVNTAEDCKYHHGYSTAGVAEKPNVTKWRSSTARRSWRPSRGNFDNENESQSGGDVDVEGEGDLVLQEVNDENDDEWGDAGWEQKEDRYKPPHVRYTVDNGSW